MEAASGQLHASHLTSGKICHIMFWTQNLSYHEAVAYTMALMKCVRLLMCKDIFLILSENMFRCKLFDDDSESKYTKDS